MAFLVRPPRGREGSACQHLLAVPGSPANDESLVAVTERPYRFLGATAWREGTDARGRPLWQFRLKVLRTERRHGIGHALVQALIQNARQQNVGFLRADVVLQSEPEAAAFLTRLGFSHVDRRREFEGDIELSLRTAER